MEYDLYGPIRRRNNQNNQGKGEFVDEEISGGRNSNLASEIGEGSVERRLQETPSTSSEPIATTFSLAEADKNEKLLEMATKFGLTMTVEKYLKGGNQSYPLFPFQRQHLFRLLQWPNCSEFGGIGGFNFGDWQRRGTTMDKGGLGPIFVGYSWQICIPHKMPK